MGTSEVLFILYACVSSVILVHLLIESITWRGRAERLKDLLANRRSEIDSLRYTVSKQSGFLKAQDEFERGC